jgi:pimeloyl-ACP methyl ester carboxylesterase
MRAIAGRALLGRNQIRIRAWALVQIGGIAMTAVEHQDEASFVDLQGQLLAHYSVDATSRYVELDRPALRAHLLEAGHGDPVVIVHGGDGEAVNWAPLMAVLQDRFHIYAVDRPGFGLTDRFDYRGVSIREHASDFMSSLLDALDLESATLIGGSFGGYFGMTTALDHPERARALVLVGMPVGVSRSLSLMVRLLAGVPGAARLLMKRAATMKGQRAQYEHEFHIDPDSVPELYFRTRIAGVKRPGAQETFATVFRRIGGLRGIDPEFYLGEELAGLEVPTLFIWGERDDMAPIDDGRAVSERMPNAAFVVLEGIGHFPFLEAPEETGRLIGEFVGRAPTEDDGRPRARGKAASVR